MKKTAAYLIVRDGILSFMTGERVMIAILNTTIQCAVGGIGRPEKLLKHINFGMEKIKIFIFSQFYCIQNLQNTY